MKNIKLYLRLIEPKLLNLIDGKPKELIEMVKKGFSDDDIELSFCKQKYDNSYLRNIKSRTMRALQMLVIISPSKGGSVLKKKIENCQKNFLISHKFLTQDDREEGFKLAKQAYKESTEYGFTHLSCELSSMLQHHHVYYDRNPRLAKLYARKCRQHLLDYAAEKEAELCFVELVEKMNKRHLKKEELCAVVEHLTQLEGQSIKYKVYEASVKVLYGAHQGNYQQIMFSCKSVLRFFDAKKGAYPAHYLFFLRNLGVAQTAVGKFQEASASFESAKQFTINKPYNAYTLQFYQTINALHAGEYQTAYEWYQKNRRCKINYIRENFAIIEAYLYFLCRTGHLAMTRPFRMSKYLNETLQMQQDKQGSNINILIAELLVYLVKDRARFIDRVESIQKYSHRHLGGKHNLRAKYFLKILCLLPKVDFHSAALIRRAEKYITSMREQPVRLGEHFAVEIVPLEVLLEMIVEQLHHKVA